MKHNIVIDKLSGPLFIMLTLIVLDFTLILDLNYPIVFALILFAVLSFFSLIITDRYLTGFESEMGEIKLNYHKNFSRDEDVIKLHARAISSVETNVKSFLNPYYKIDLFYKSEDGEGLKKTFKTTDKRLFNQILANVYTNLSETMN